MNRAVVSRVVIALALSVVGTRMAHAETFLSPYVGFNFGGDSGCQQPTRCTDRSLNVGVALGTMGPIGGFEEDFGFAKDFFGAAKDEASSVVTLMSNIIVGPRIGPLRPYGAAGLGIIETRVKSDLSNVGQSETGLGWDIGGGLMVGLRHLALRGDVRYFHGLQDVSFLPASDLKIDFGRASAGIVLRF